MMKKAFTLIELMVVLSIIGVLLGITVQAVSGQFRNSREQKASALCAIVHQGIETYRAQKDRWPGSVGDRIAGGDVLSRGNDEGFDNTSDYNKYVLESSEVRDMVKTVVREAVNNGNPMMDISALYVSSSPGEKHDRGYGLDFMDAVRGTERHPQKMSVDQMYFGYPDPSTGYFRRFKIVYSVPTDSMEVMRQ